MTTTDLQDGARVRITGPFDGTARAPAYDGSWRILLDNGGVAYLRPEHLEVIPEPLKRGDIVNSATDPEPGEGCVLRGVDRADRVIGRDRRGWWIAGSAAAGLLWPDFRDDGAYRVIDVPGAES